jgi:hypothetical protein
MSAPSSSAPSVEQKIAAKSPNQKRLLLWAGLALCSFGGLYAGWYAAGKTMLKHVPTFLESQNLMPTWMNKLSVLAEEVMTQLIQKSSKKIDIKSSDIWKKICKITAKHTKFSGFPFGWTFYHDQNSLGSISNEMDSYLAAAGIETTDPKEKEQEVMITQWFKDNFKADLSVHIPLNAIWSKTIEMKEKNKIEIDYKAQNASIIWKNENNIAVAKKPGEKGLALSFSLLKSSNDLKGSIRQKGGLWESQSFNNAHEWGLDFLLDKKPVGQAKASNAPLDELPEKVEFFLTKGLFQPLDPLFYGLDHPAGNELKTQGLMGVATNLEKILTPQGLRLSIRPNYLIQQKNEPAQPAQTTRKAPSDLPAALSNQISLAFGAQKLPAITLTLAAKTRDQAHIILSAPIQTVQALLDKIALSGSPVVQMVQLVLYMFVRPNQKHITFNVTLSAKAEKTKFDAPSMSLTIPTPKQHIDTFIKLIFGL